MNKQKYKLAIFDIDGTLLDTSEGLLASTIYMINQLGFSMPEEEVLLSFVGPRIQDSVQRVFGLHGEQLKKATDIFRNHYKEKDVLRARPYEGIYDVLSALKKHGIHITAATNKRQDFTDELMERYKFSQYIEGVYGTDMMSKLRKTDLIHKCLDRFPECCIKEAVMIGDSDYDAQAAYEVGIDFVGVTYGFGFSAAGDVADWPYVGICHSPRELIKILLC